MPEATRYQSRSPGWRTNCKDKSQKHPTVGDAMDNNLPGPSRSRKQQKTAMSTKHISDSSESDDSNKPSSSNESCDCDDSDSWGNIC